MKTKTIAGIFAAILSFSTLPIFADTMQQDAWNDQQEMENTQAADPITISIVGGWIVDAAKNAILNELKSLIKDSLFGSSSGPNYVLLHEQALQQIEDIVEQVIITSDVEDAKSALLSFSDLINYYHITAQDDSPDLSIMPILINYATSLKNHQAYRVEYNPEAYLLTASYTLVTSLTLAIYTERVLQDEFPEDDLSEIADALYVQLNGLGARAYTYIRDNIEFRETSACWDDHGVISELLENVYSTNGREAALSAGDVAPGLCKFSIIDHIGNQHAGWIAGDDPDDRREALTAASAYQNSLRETYEKLFMGEDYDDVISKLQSF
jgi:hypothetical protein